MSIWRLLKHMKTRTPIDPIERGLAGEQSVATALGSLGTDFIVQNDVLIRLMNSTRTTQIDHLVLSRCGIFVIETKNVHGIIVGADGYKYWTVISGNKKYQIYSPVLQNEQHVKTVQAIIGFDVIVPIFSIIVFPDSSSLVRVNSRTPVVHLHYLVHCIQRLSRAIVLLPEDLVGIAKRIDSVRLFQQDDRTRHIADIHTGRERLVQAAKEGRVKRFCMICGAPMVYWEGPYGPYWGCSKYPECSHTENI